MKKLILLCSVILSMDISFTAVAQQVYKHGYNSIEQAKQTSEQHVDQMSDAEIAQMLAPIALYPDSLLTHILIASTYPLEIVEAHRWLKKNDSLNVKQVAKAIEDFDWDASVKALVPFEQILSRLSDDLSWMQQLGEAFLQDESRVLASIQTLRYEAKHAGNLNKMTNMEVSYDDDNIIIEPKEREVVYVPYYDTRMVYGNWRWSSYPPVYWTSHHRVYINHHNPFYWHSGIRISFNYFFSTFHWHNRHVMVINPTRTHHYRPRKLITHGGYAKRWLHKPAHRKSYSYKNKAVRKKYYGNSVKSTKYESRHLNKRIAAPHSVSKRQSNQSIGKIETNAEVAKASKVVTHKRHNQKVLKRAEQGRTNHTYRKESLNAKSFNRSKERHSRDLH